MYEVTASTATKVDAFEKLYISKETAFMYFNMAVRADDCVEATMIDACTGIVVYQWENGKYTVMDETVLY